jgi:hypothetical protein
VPGLNGVPGKTCTYDGYITRDACGRRGRLTATMVASCSAPT